MKKLMLSAVPLLVAVGFAVTPAMASAAQREYGTCSTGTQSGPCPTGEKFKAFTAGEKVEVLSSKSGSSPFVLENVAKTAGVECSYFSDKGHVENVGTAPTAIGKSSEKLVFAECKGSGALKECVINPPSEAITGTVSDEVNAKEETEITLSAGFNLKCNATELGNVTGKATGTVAGNVTTFAAATGLTFRSEAATITGKDALYTEVGLKPIFG